MRENATKGIKLDRLKSRKAAGKAWHTKRLLGKMIKLNRCVVEENRTERF